MTRLEGHPRAANYGPEIHLPDAYQDHWDCPTCDTTPSGTCPAHCDECDQAPNGLCHTCADDLHDTEAELWLQAREDTGDD